MEYPTILVNYYPRHAEKSRQYTSTIRRLKGLSKPSTRSPAWLFWLLISATGATADVCGEALWPYEVQGTGDTSPLEGQMVQVRGTVTYTDARPNGLRGFFIQGDSDNDARTSEALFIYAPGHSPSRLQDVVVEGEVKEFHGLTELTRVQSVTVCGRSALPDPVALTDPAEPLENMRVQLPETRIIDNYRLFDVGELVLSDGEHRWTMEDASNDRQLSAVPWGLPQDPVLVAHGQRLAPITGVLTWRWNRWVILPDRTPTLTGTVDWGHRPARDDRLRLATFNVENLFNGTHSGFGDSRGAQSQAEWEQQRQKVAQAIIALDADVLMLQEVEHDQGQAPEVLPELIAQLNTMSERTYAALAPSVRPGDDAITNAFLYDIARLKPDGGLIRIENDPRPALVQAFQPHDSAQRFKVINVHMKSRGRGCSNVCARERGQEMATILTWLEDNPSEAPRFFGGDFNTLTDEPLWEPLLQADWTRADVVRPTYWFRGQPQQIDHIWYQNLEVTPDAWVQPGHAEMPPMPFTHPLYDVSTPWGASDHNPVVLEF